MSKKQVSDNSHRYKGEAGNLQYLQSDDGPGSMKSIKGWILIAKGIHEEAQEDDLFDAFSKYGPIKNLHFNLDRRTGFVKGFTLVEFNELMNLFMLKMLQIVQINQMEFLVKRFKLTGYFNKPNKKGVLKQIKKQ